MIDFVNFIGIRGFKIREDEVREGSRVFDD